MLAGQYWSYPRNDGSLSYKMIESLLTEYRTRLASAVNVQVESITKSASDCSPVDPTAPGHVVADGTGGLGLNEFVCYNEELIQKEYLQCPVEVTSSPPPPVPAPSPPPPTPSVQEPDTSDAIAHPWSTVWSMAVMSLCSFML